MDLMDSFIRHISVEKNNKEKKQLACAYNNSSRTRQTS